MTDWVRRIASVPGREARLGLWAEALQGLSAQQGAELLDRLVQAASMRDPEAVSAYLPLLDQPGFTSRVGAGRLSDILLAARDADLAACLLLLEDPGRRSLAERLGPPPDPVVEALTLGHRKAAARGLRSPLLERILKDPDPRVIREALRNPRLREQEVLAIASRRPCPEEVFWLLVRSEVWIARLPVRRAVTLNPFAPPRLAAALLPTLLAPDLNEIWCDPSSLAGLRDAAAHVLAWRRSAELNGHQIF
jgi:hypothetical protein